MKIKNILTITFLTILAASSYGQSMSSGKYEVKLDTLMTLSLKFMEKDQVVYSGYITVSKKGKFIETYYFIMPEKDGKPSHLAVKNKSGMQDLIEPRIYYNDSTKTFSFYQGTPKEGKETVQDCSDIKHIILSGMLIWYKLEK